MSEVNSKDMIASNYDPTMSWNEFALLSHFRFCLQCFDAVGLATGRASGL